MNKALILVVEDDRPIRNLIVTTLKTHDYKYITAENGSSAILEASSHKPEIILLDLGLPDMEGTACKDQGYTAPISIDPVRRGTRTSSLCKWRVKDRLYSRIYIFKR